jgi:hypothetical protein
MEHEERLQLLVGVSHADQKMSYPGDHFCAELGVMLCLLCFWFQSSHANQSGLRVAALEQVTQQQTLLGQELSSQMQSARRCQDAQGVEEGRVRAELALLGQLAARMNAATELQAESKQRLVVDPPPQAHGE